MVNLVPAVLVGGPPHAGKSVLFYQLTQALRERGVLHYALRACPDGEGNWFHEGPQELVTTIRVKHGQWPTSFVRRICQDLEHRCLPFLVDMGGHPQPAQEYLLRLCTHALLLLREDLPDDVVRWQQLVENYNLLPLARLLSQREGISTITSHMPMLEGTISGLERHTSHAGAGQIFDELVVRLAALFGSYDLRDQKEIYLRQAPTELVIDLQSELRALTSTSTTWEPAMLSPLLDRLPAQVPLSVFGAGPGWLYAALADPHPCYLFDPKLPFGWVQSAPVSLGMQASPEIQIAPENCQEASVLKISFPNERLDYFLLDTLAFPPVSQQKGLIISGKVPYWLLTAVVRLYKTAGVPWIAPFYVPVSKSVVAYSRVASPRPGDLVPLPLT